LNLLLLLCSGRLLSRDLLVLRRDGRLEFGDCALLLCNFGLLFCDPAMFFQRRVAFPRIPSRPVALVEALF
jgi:hypothetical protein